MGYTQPVRTDCLGALAEPNRMRIVELLRGGPRPVGAIAEELKLRQPQVSKHLRVLSEAGWVEALPLAQRRIYRLQPKPIEELDSWLETFKQVWDSRLDTLDEYLQGLKQEQKRGRR